MSPVSLRSGRAVSLRSSRAVSLRSDRAVSVRAGRAISLTSDRAVLCSLGMHSYVQEMCVYKKKLHFNILFQNYLTQDGLPGDLLREREQTLLHPESCWIICSGVPDCHSARGSEGNTGSKGVFSLSWETSDTGRFGVLPRVNSSHRQNVQVHRLVL